MLSYLAYVVDYRGFMPQNGDSDLDNAAGTVTAAAAEFQRDDWLFLATGGHNGTEPEGPPSSFFPWAGQMVMRNAWPGSALAPNASADAYWAWMNVGPGAAASGHAHEDKLSLCLNAFGRFFLIDSGRFNYNGIDKLAMLFVSGLS